MIQAQKFVTHWHTSSTSTHNPCIGALPALFLKGKCCDTVPLLKKVRGKSGQDETKILKTKFAGVASTKIHKIYLDDLKIGINTDRAATLLTIKNIKANQDFQCQRR